MRIDPENFDSIATHNGVLIACEGTFRWENGSVSYFDFSTKQVSNNLFFTVNSRPLGDVVQSIAVNDKKAFIIVNNSNKIEVVDMPAFKSCGTITGINSPRYLIFVSETKAYVSSLYGNVIYIVNPATLKVTGTLNTGSSTEQLLWVNDKILAANWSHGNKIYVINPANDNIVSTINTGIEPNSMTLDKNNKLWVLCSGGYAHNENATLIRLNSNSFEKEKTYTFSSGSYPTKLCFNGARDTLFFLDKGIFNMSISSSVLPEKPFINQGNRNFYGLAYDASAPQILVTNVLDFQQPGYVHRFKSSGLPIDSFKVSIGPGEFCFY